jgi:hypothetical protein
MDVMTKVACFLLLENGSFIAEPYINDFDEFLRYIVHFIEFKNDSELLGTAKSKHLI